MSSIGNNIARAGSVMGSMAGKGGAKTTPSFDLSGFDGSTTTGGDGTVSSNFDSDNGGKSDESDTRSNSFDFKLATNPDEYQPMDFE